MIFRTIITTMKLFIQPWDYKVLYTILEPNISLTLCNNMTFTTNIEIC